MGNVESLYSIKLKDIFMDGKFYYIIMQLCEYNLDNFVKKKRKIKCWFIKNINHRAIKENILIIYIN